MKKVTLILVFFLFLAACSSSESDEAQEVDSAELEQACLDEGGIFIAEHNECEDISEDACTELGGEYDECASACRHEPADMVCTAQCVLVCSFDTES
ncbi:MAG TPA: hypothetical protein VLE70_08370 [Anaerolineae bacterium]|jgi:hypothetical protein|nr:hypothetical protein [Anaerolineae bacterium]